MAPVPTASPGQPPHDLDCLSVADLEAQAYHRMDKQTRDYYNEGADYGTTLKENSSAYAKYRIRPRVLRDISMIDTSVDLFGRTVRVPIGAAPTAMQGLAHSDAEEATARACRNAGWAMGLSSFATRNVEEVATAFGTPSDREGTLPPQILQLYLFEERAHSKRLIQRAKKAGYKAVFLTVDTPMIGRRNLEIKNQFSLPKHLKLANFSEDQEKEARKDAQAVSGQGVAAESKKKEDSARGYSDGQTRHPPAGPISFHTHAPNPTLCWDKDIDWLKKECGSEMEVWIKGVATAEDAQLALHHGVDGIVVSNHGGRQLDGALATLDALPEVVQAVQDKIPVHVDGGIRHGTDAFKALALGANFVWIGRPILWGLAYNGQEGVELCLRLLSDEFRLCMGLAGVVSVQDISKDFLAKIDKSGFVSRL